MTPLELRDRLVEITRELRRLGQEFHREQLAECDPIYEIARIYRATVRMNDAADLLSTARASLEINYELPNHRSEGEG